MYLRGQIESNNSTVALSKIAANLKEYQKFSNAARSKQHS